ncbi:MAG TPA: ferrous iron transport protein A [Ruminococcaceae bacterium]|jgi:Fe2+ transport system protein FeoA|nr:FeoA family protein [Oscillospiraceae bacterium]HCC01591.1 ferrous iron transport protein A [Oscillospiraceae bacterium]HCM23222.1 ferrous iron transport protein A [Oscillospiraceae bacterium]
MTLDKLPIGQQAVIKQVGGEGALRRHMLEMGLTPHTKVSVRKVAPMGDPIQLELRGYELTLRLEDAKNITLEDET